MNWRAHDWREQDGENREFVTQALKSDSDGRARDLFSQLPYREQEILKLRLGLEDKPKERAEVADIFSIATWRLQQIESISLEHLADGIRRLP